MNQLDKNVSHIGEVQTHLLKCTHILNILAETELPPGADITLATLMRTVAEATADVLPVQRSIVNARNEAKDGVVHYGVQTGI